MTNAERNATIRLPHSKDFLYLAEYNQRRTATEGKINPKLMDRIWNARKKPTRTAIVVIIR